MKTTLLTQPSRVALALYAIGGLMGGACGPPPTGLGRTAVGMVTEEGPGKNATDGSIVLDFAPGEAGAPAPGTFKPGMRLTYNVVSASVAGIGSDWTPDENGAWVNPKTGERFDRSKKEMSGSSHTLEEYNVIALDEKRCILMKDNFLVNPTFAAPTASGREFKVGTPGFATDIWANPESLKRLPNIVGKDRKIVRGKWRMGQKMTDAVMLSEAWPSSKDLYAYDLATGLMIEYSISGTGHPTALAPDESQSTGNTIMVSGWIVGARAVSVPWATEADPDWTKSLHSITFSGQSLFSAQSNGAGATPQNITVKFTVKDRENGWTSLVRTDTVTDAQGQSKSADAPMVTSPWSIDPLWIAPGALARLKSGQIIDTDGLTKVSVRVGQIMPGPKGQMLDLIYGNAAMETHCGYDLTTGMLVGLQSYNSGTFTRMNLKIQSTD